jgi:hypothetical protein
MPPKHHDPRIIAVDLRSQQFGYAVFDGPERLLDYGGGQLRPGGKAGSILAARRIRQLMKLFTPSAIAVKRPDRRVEASHPGIRIIANAIRREASQHLIPCRLLARNEIRQAFSTFSAGNKYEIAAVLAQMFPELLSRLPADREPGDCEHPRMVVFDAISVGFTYWQENSAHIAPPD